MDHRRPDSFLPLTPLSTSILVAIAGGARHGYAILKELEERGGGARVPGAGSLYAALQRLVDEGLLREEATEAGEAEGPPRRCYGLTALGREVARLELRRLAAMVELGASRRLGPVLRPRTEEG